MPRARGHLQRFFSDTSWTVDDDVALAAAVGPGTGWFTDALEPDLVVSFGWRGGRFKVDVEFTSDAETAAEETTADAAPAHSRTLGDTFDDTMVMEVGGLPTEVRFLTGPGTGGNATVGRTSPGTDARVVALFDRFPDVMSVQLAPGIVAVTIADAEHWHEVLLPLFDEVRSGFVPERPPVPDRQLERARAELGDIRPDDRGLAKLISAASSPDAAQRRVAVARFEGGDITAARGPWTAALDDQSRAVRRAAARAMAYARRSELRDLLERALDDKDACVRYYGLRGLAAIAPSTGVDPSLTKIEKRRHDDDLRVRVAAAWARVGQTPP
ncbi:MAG: HEAT repeat domain-containing protein [Actinomycetota bacterium]|nr:HEAT repeat domain-containing protein [Actinomycetota bacterium]